jgi:hypothetical protein
MLTDAQIAERRTGDDHDWNVLLNADDPIRRKRPRPTGAGIQANEGDTRPEKGDTRAKTESV